ncbi:hypothetical protein [Bradyrhizobium sp. STM 3562]|uniref:hypothetical protein n=1 Tax=Bradyrhizobium sp. STM 3562 TaxID=578924 RepID=UPI00388DFE14
MLSDESLPIRCAAASLIIVTAASFAAPAFAYRPFDGTDAAVAEPGELEVELQPAGPRREQGTTTLIAPQTVLNFGLSEGWEAVFEGQAETPLSFSGPTELTAAGAFLKHVVVPGSLQDKSGPSVATEFGVLLPDSTGDSGVGASWAGIVSQRWDWGTVHFNTEALLTRDHHADVFVGTILEGPSKWKVRPVAEVFYEKEFGLEETVSGLVGLIWQASDKLAFDIAYRYAVTKGHPVNEIRAGLTFAVPLRLFGSSHAR